MRRKGLIALVFAMSLTAGHASQAEAKLGELFGIFQSRIIGSYKFKGHSSKNGREYFMYTMNTDSNTEAAAPGFGGGLTITTENGMIVGESMLMRVGDNIQAGKSLMALHALDFAFESLDRPAPASKKEIEQEVKSYTSAVNKALSGQPQNITYVGGKGKITLSKRADGSLAIAATPN